MQRTKVIILSVLALLGVASTAAAFTTLWTSTTVKPVITLRYQNPNSGKNVVQSYPSTGANFLEVNQDGNRDLFMTLRARNSDNSLNVTAEAIGMGILLPSGANTAVLSWQDSLDLPTLEFPNAMTMTAQSAVIKGSYSVNGAQTASGNFTLDVAGTLTLGGSPIPARMTATFSSGPMARNPLSGYSTISRGFVPPPASPIAPTAANQTASAAFGATAKVNLLIGAKSFQTNTALTATIVSPPPNGTLSSITTGPNSATVVYTPKPNFAGTDVFSFTVTDSQGLTSAVQLVTVTVAAGPSATTLVQRVEKNSTGTANPTLIDFSSLNLGTNVFVSNVTGATNGAVTKTGNNLPYTFSYTPNIGFTGLDTLTYTLATTANSAAFATGEVDVQVCPIAVNYFQSLNGTSSAQVNVLTNDIPLNASDTLAVTSFSAPSYGKVTLSGSTLTYLFTTPTSGVTEDTFTYTVTESGILQTSTGVITIILQ